MKNRNRDKKFPDSPSIALRKNTRVTDESVREDFDIQQAPENFENEPASQEIYSQPEQKEVDVKKSQKKRSREDLEAESELTNANEQESEDFAADPVFSADNGYESEDFADPVTRPDQGFESEDFAAELAEKGYESEDFAADEKAVVNVEKQESEEIALPSKKKTRVGQSRSIPAPTELRRSARLQKIAENNPKIELPPALLNRKRKYDQETFHNKKEKEENAEWKGESKKRKFVGDMTKLRSDNTDPEKVSVLVDFKKLNINADKMKLLQLYESLHESVSSKVSEMSNFTPVKKIHFNENKSPEKITSRSGQVYHRTLKFGPINVYTKGSPFKSPSKQPVIRELPQDSKFFTTNEFKAIKVFKEEVKKQLAIFNAKLDKKVKAEKRERKKISRSQRKTTQNRLMEAKLKKGQARLKTNPGSANDYANQMELIKLKEPLQMKWEWLHLLPYAIFGELSQTDLNLVGGTFHANTLMMYIENVLKPIAKVYPEGFTLDITAHMVVGTQMGSILEYKIKTRDFELPFTVDLLTLKKPLYIYNTFLTIVVNAILQEIKKLDKELPDSMDIEESKVESSLTSAVTTDIADNIKKESQTRTNSFALFYNTPFSPLPNEITKSNTTTIYTTPAPTTPIKKESSPLNSNAVFDTPTVSRTDSEKPNTNGSAVKKLFDDEDKEKSPVKSNSLTSNSIFHKHTTQSSPAKNKKEMKVKKEKAEKKVVEQKTKRSLFKG